MTVAFPAPFPTALEAFVELFDREAFWESAFVHVQRGNPHGIGAQLAKAERFLQEFCPAYLGIDVGPLLSHARVCRKVVRENPDALGDRWKEVIRFPKIRLRPEHLLGTNRSSRGDGYVASIGAVTRRQRRLARCTCVRDESSSSWMRRSSWRISGFRPVIGWRSYVVIAVVSTASG